MTPVRQFLPETFAACRASSAEDVNQCNDVGIDAA